MNRRRKKTNNRNSKKAGKTHNTNTIDSTIKEQEVSIDTLSHDGKGVGRTPENKVVFVEGALPNERVKYAPLESKKNFSTGVVTAVIEASSMRVEPKCKIFGKCGGCALQHLDPQEQILHKQQQLLDNLSKIGNVTVSPEQVLEPMTSDPWNYRRRARFGTTYAHTKKELRLGFRAKNSHYIQPTVSCDILKQQAADLLPALKTSLSQLSVVENISAVEVCDADNTMAVIIQYKGMLSSNDEKHLVEFAKQSNVQLLVDDKADSHGGLKLMHPQQATPLFYQHSAFDIKIEFGPRDFIQVNGEVNEQLVAQAVELLDIQETDKVLDLFCGLGNFTLPIARKAQHVAGVEGDDALIHRANHNTKLNQLHNVTFYYGDLFDQNMNKETHGAWLNQSFDKILLDPPRAGAAEIVRNIDRFNASKIVYISCDPATLSRDTNILVNEKGYVLKSAGVIDMFPQTGHVESIAVFEKN